MTEVQVESVKAKAFGVLEALESRNTFILSYEGIASCLDEGVINQVTQRVEYFMDESDAASVKHTFDAFCVKILQAADKEGSLTACSILLYTYLVIETKRNEMLTIMLSILANSEEYKQLSYGYLAVQEQQKNKIADWLTTTFGDEDGHTY